MLYAILLRDMSKRAKVFSMAAAALLVALISDVPSSAQSLGDGSVQSGINAARGNGVPGFLMGDGGILTTIINTMLFVVGFLSVVMLIFGGIRYVVSGGNTNSVTAAKNTILYAIVGLLISLFAYAIVNFVLDSIIGGAGGGGTNL